MKTIKNTKTGELKRVSEAEAHKTVGSTWNFVPKSEWKESTRPKKVEKEEKKG
jgi:hypothetical protein